MRNNIQCLNFAQTVIFQCSTTLYITLADIFAENTASLFFFSLMFILHSREVEGKSQCKEKKESKWSSLGAWAEHKVCEIHVCSLHSSLFYPFSPSFLLCPHALQFNPSLLHILNVFYLRHAILFHSRIFCFYSFLMLFYYIIK